MIFKWSQYDRITPACAGKSRPGPRHPGQPEDHPRLCGEKLRNWLGNARCNGSPPPVRGKEACHLMRAAVEGITPACAGKRH